MDDGKLQFGTEIDKSGFERGLKDINSAAGSAMETMKGILGSDLIKSAASAVVDFGKKAIALASDLDEVQNVVDVTFGESAAAVEDFAKTSSTQFGLTELQVKQYSGTLGAMVKSMGLTEKEAADMSLDMVGLAGDVASFYNLDHDTAFEKIRSGLSGETEPLKQLGINMSQANLEAFALDQGIKTAYKDMSEAERVTLRYNYIMNATSDAHGDFARTSDGYANQVRVLENNISTLAANMGKLLLPAVNAGVGALNSLFEPREDPELSVTITGIQEAIDALTGEENGFEAQLDRIKMKYAEDVIEIRVNYQNAQKELDNYETLLADYENEGLFNDKESNIKIGMEGEDVGVLQAKLTALGYTIAADELVSSKFGATTLAAVLAFQKANGLAEDGIAGVETKTALTAQTATEAQQSVQALVGMYEDLAQYVDPDTGLFKIEADEVRALIAQYNELARAKAYATMMSDYETAYYQAEMNYNVLSNRRDDAAKELEKKRSVYAQRSSLLAYGESMALNWTIEGNWDELGAEQFKQAAQYVNDYIDAFNGLNGIDMEWLEELYGADVISGLFNTGGMVDAEATRENLGALFNMIQLLNKAAGEQLNGDEAELQTYIENYNAANEALNESYEMLTQAQTEYAEMATVYNDTFNGVGEAIATELGAGVLANTSTAIADINSFFRTLNAEIDAGTAELQRRASSAGNIYAGGYLRRTSNGHATGLSYVPYDNYAARLHVGEAVLTANEAERWRAGQSGGGIDAGTLVGAIREASADRRDVVITVDGHELARYMADANRGALADRAGRLAKGRGL